MVIVNADIGMPADLPKDRAGVQARPAADTVQRLGQRRLAQGAAPVIQEDQVTLARREAGVLLRFWAADQTGVDGHLLPGGRARQQGEHHCQVIQRRQQPLHAHQGDMHPGQGGDHAPIALVGQYDQGAALGDAEIHAGNADLGLQEDLAQGAAGGVGHGGDVFGVGDAQFFGEKLPDLLAAQMHGGGDQVGGRLAAQLDDVFAQVGLDDAHAGGFERRVEGDFLAEHGFGFGNQGRRPDRTANLQHGLHGGRGVGGAVDDHAVGAGLGDELLQVAIQVGDDLGADGARLLAHGVRIGQRGESDGAPFQAAFGVAVQGDLQIRVGQGGADAGVKRVGGHIVLAGSGAAAQDGGLGVQ